jgi:AAA15 family ATPase/GTPase
MIQVSAIKLPATFDTYKDTTGVKADFLTPLSKINIFVGSNNSGKSRFVRILSSLPLYDIEQQNIELESIKLGMLSVFEDFNNFLDTHRAIKAKDIDKKTIESMRKTFDGLITLGQDRFNEIRTHFKDISTSSFLRVEAEGGGHYTPGTSQVEQMQREIKIIANRANTLLDKIPIQSESNAPKKVYIPTLRGLRQLEANHKDLYAERTAQDYFSTENQGSAPEIFTGLTLYHRLIDLLLGNNSERKLIADYQEFISKTLFEGKPVALIPNPREKVVVVKIGNEKEQPIHHLGDGIQSAIILSFLPYVMREQTFFFIEEPEMYLHPGLQRKILNFFDSLERHTFFLTTHSNHFLDITIDIKDAAVFTFRKLLDSDDDELTPNFTIEAVDSGYESSLELLGVRNSSVFLVNATVWVEGITDRWYIREMLNSYMDYLAKDKALNLRLDEDSHYSFVEYGGANITHFSFLDYETHPIEVDRLCAKAIVIIDGDGEKKMKRKDDLEKTLGERLIILPCREVENLLPYDVIKQVVIEYEKNSALTLPEHTYDKYQDKYLGKFIEDKMLKTGFARKGGYQAESGTLKNKVDFCEKALDKIQYVNLPESTKEVIQSIYQFIYERNA